MFLQFDILLKVVTTNTGLWDVTSHRLTATIQVSDERNACAFNVHWETEFFRSIVKSYQTTARYIPDNWYQRSHNHVPVSKYVLRNVVITRNCPQMELWSFSSKMWFMYGFSSSLEHVIYIYMCVCVCVCVKYISSVRIEDADILCLFTQDLVTDPQFESTKVFMMTWYAAKY